MDPSFLIAASQAMQQRQFVQAGITRAQQEQDEDEKYWQAVKDRFNGIPSMDTLKCFWETLRQKIMDFYSGPEDLNKNYIP